jgi:spermidine synthase
MHSGRVTEAIQWYEQALRIDPDHAEAHFNLGLALARAGKVLEAIGHWEQALRIRPGYAEAHNSLGNALAQVGRPQEALQHYEQALKVKPDYVEAQNNLAWLLAALPAAEGGDPLRAVTLAEQGCRITGNQSPAYLDTLAVAYAAAGQFSQAIATSQKAIELARAAGRTELATEIQARLQLYRNGRAYRLPPRPLQRGLAAPAGSPDP